MYIVKHLDPKELVLPLSIESVLKKHFCDLTVLEEWTSEVVKNLRYNVILPEQNKQYVRKSNMFLSGSKSSTPISQYSRPFFLGEAKYL
jgi:hypothetical protein